MTTALGIIVSALKKIKVLTKSETPDANDSADALVSLNALLSSWSNDGLTCYARVNESFSLVAGTASYTIGTGATFNTTRPLFIASAFIRSGTTDYEIKEIITDEQYDSLPVKTTQSIPSVLNYTSSFPNGRIRLYETPSSNYSLYITSEKEITALAITDTISFPPGWERALTYNLAVEINPEYGQPLDALVFETAKDSLGQIRINTARNRPIMYKPSVGGVNNILTDSY